MVKILSWNIWCEGDFEEKAKFLRSCGADIIGLQEVILNSKELPVAPLLTSLGYGYVYAPSFMARAGVEAGVAVFSKYPIVGSKVHFLSEEKRRSAMEAEINVSGKILQVFSAHLMHAHLQFSEIQNLQTENLIKILPKEKTIVMGDFNATPESFVFEQMNKVLQNSDPALTPTWSMYPEGCPVCKPEKIDTRLDYIFTSSDLKISSPKVEASKGSDHLPISIVVEI